MLTTTANAQSPRASRSEMLTLGVGNALIGASIAGVVARARGAPVGKAILAGASGGLLSFYGKTILSSTRVPIAAIAGSSVSAAGASLASNAAAGRPLHSQIRIPIGPLRATVALDHLAAPTWSVNAYESIVFAALIIRSDVKFSPERSMRTATGVFSTSAGVQTSELRGYAGYSIGGAAVVSRSAPDPASTLNHEMVHVLQQRFLQEALGTAVDQSILRRITRRAPPRWLELGVTMPALLLVDHAFRGEGPMVRLLQWEAERLERPTR